MDVVEMEQEVQGNIGGPGDSGGNRFSTSSSNVVHTAGAASSSASSAAAAASSSSSYIEAAPLGMDIGGSVPSSLASQSSSNAAMNKMGSTLIKEKGVDVLEGTEFCYIGFSDDVNTIIGTRHPEYSVPLVLNWFSSLPEMTVSGVVMSEHQGEIEKNTFLFSDRKTGLLNTSMGMANKLLKGEGAGTGNLRERLG